MISSSPTRTLGYHKPSGASQQGPASGELTRTYFYQAITMDDQPTPEQVEAVLKGAQSKSAPHDSDLLPVYKFVLPSKPDQSISTSISSEASSSSHAQATKTSGNGRVNHFYCAKNPSELHREAATYLIFLFAFKRDGMPKRFLDELERVLQGCTSCARAFGGARRKFAKTYVKPVASL